MFAFLLTLLILDALVLCLVVLLQAGQGGGLASLGGATTDTVLGGRQAVTLLTKATWWCGGIFLVLSLALSLVPRGVNPSALQERLREATPAAPGPASQLPIGGAPPTAPAPGAAAPATPGTATTPGPAKGKAAPPAKSPANAPSKGASGAPTPPKK
jgi:preprotein translocase subunit SecG